MRLAIVGAFLGLSAFWWFIPFELRAAANENILISGTKDRIPDGATRVNDSGGELYLDTKATLKLSDGGVLEFRYSRISDNGVQLRRLNRQGSIVWAKNCEGLGVMHSEYFQEVFVYLEGDTLRVVSWGSSGKFVERLALNSGKRLSRSNDCDSYGDPPRCVPYYPVPSN
jgi:hypothetical protein